MKTKLLFIMMLGFSLMNLEAQASGWAALTPFGGTARWRAVGFSIGSKGYIGTGMTGTSTTGYCKDFWEYDPTTNAWTQKNDFGGTARYGAVGFSIGSKGYIGTGYDSSNAGQHSYVNDFWEYDTTANAWNQKMGFPGAARCFAVGFSIGDKGYIGTGSQNFTYYNDFYEYNPSNNSWSVKDSFPVARQCATGFSIGGKGYIGTGGVSGSNDFNDFYQYDPITDNWIAKANFIGTARRYAVGISIGNKGYIGTGYHGATTYQDFYEYNPDLDTWTGQTNYQHQVRNATGFSICTKGYVGTGAFTATSNDFYEFTPTYLPAAGFIASQTSICEGTCINFTDTSTNAPSSWSWSFQGGTPGSATIQNPTNICFSTAGSYIISLTATGVSCSLTTNDSIDVHPFPSIPVITEGTNTLSCSDTGATYQWYLNGALQQQDTTQVITITSAQNGSWYVVVTSSFGCSSTSAAIQTSVGINELTNNIYFSIYPNPATLKIEINSMFQLHNAQIEIYNLLGEKLYSAALTKKEKTINTELFTKGIYFVKMTDGEKKMIQKLIIE